MVLVVVVLVVVVLVVVFVVVVIVLVGFIVGVIVVVIVVVIIVVVIVVVCVDHVGCQGGREDGEAHEVEHVEAVAGAGAAPVAASYIAGHAS